jgi:hypothetical protein
MQSQNCKSLSVIRTNLDWLSVKDVKFGSLATRQGQDKVDITKFINEANKVQDAENKIQTVLN